MKFKIKVSFRLYMWVATKSFSRHKLVSKFFYWVASHLSTSVKAIRSTKPMTISHLIGDVFPLPIKPYKRKDGSPE